jgi:hypothetical protein
MTDPPLGPLLVSVAERVLTITVFIAVGVGLANVAVAFGAVDCIGALAAPLTCPANLPREVGTAILATTASPTAGYGMLAEYRESGVLAGALLLSETNVDTTVDPEVDAGATTDGGDQPETTRAKLRQAGRETVEKVRDILPRLAVIYTLVSVVVARYDVTTATSVADPLAAPARPSRRCSSAGSSPSPSRRSNARSPSSSASGGPSSGRK